MHSPTMATKAVWGVSIAEDLAELVEVYRELWLRLACCVAVCMVITTAGSCPRVSTPTCNTLTLTQLHDKLMNVNDGGRRKYFSADTVHFCVQFVLLWASLVNHALRQISVIKSSL